MWWIYFLATFYIGSYTLWGPAYRKAFTRLSTLVSHVLCLCSQVKLVLDFMSFFTSKDPLPLCQFTVYFKRLIFIIILTSSLFLQLEIHLIFFFFFLIHPATCPVWALAMWRPDPSKNLQEVVVSSLSLAEYSRSTEHYSRMCEEPLRALRKLWKGW